MTDILIFICMTVGVGVIGALFWFAIARILMWLLDY